MPIYTNPRSENYDPYAFHKELLLRQIPQKVQMLPPEPPPAVDTEDFLEDYDARVERDRAKYLAEVDRTHPKTWKTRLATFGRVAALPVGTIAGGVLGQGIDKAKILTKHPNLRSALAVSSLLGGAGLGAYAAINGFPTARSKALNAVEDDIAEQDYNVAENAFANSKFLKDYMNERKRSERVEVGRQKRMDALFDAYHLPTGYVRNVNL